MTPTDLGAPDPYQEAMRPRWELVSDIHAATYLPPADTTAPVTSKYLIQRASNEHPEAFSFIARLVDPDGLLAYSVGSLAGQIDAAEADLARQWAPEGAEGPAAGPFGSPDDEGTEAARLSDDADGDGTNWAVLWGSARATDLLLYQEFWVVVDGVRTEAVPVTAPDDSVSERSVERAPRVRVLDPWACVRTWRHGQTLTGVRFAHTEGRMNAEGGTDEVAIYSDYLLGGWRRWEQVGSEPPAVVASGTYAYYEDAGRTAPCLPAFRVRLGLRSYHAYLWARKRLNAVNLRMRHDGALFLAATPYLHHKRSAASVPQPGGSAAEPIGPVGQAILNGSRFFETPADDDVLYVEPQLSVASVTKEALDQKDRQFQQEAYQLMGIESREVSATEVRQRSASGTDAILSVVSKALDEGENRALFLLAQTLAPDQPAGWKAASVTRSTDFVAADEAREAGELAAEVFGADGPPVGETAQLAALKRYCEKKGLAYDEDEMRADLEAWRSQRGRVSAGRRAEVRARLAAPPADGEAPEGEESTEPVAL